MNRKGAKDAKGVYIFTGSGPTVAYGFRLRQGYAPTGWRGKRSIR